MTQNIECWNAIGLMSGTSLDGVDIAYCEFTYSDGFYTFEIICAETIPYPPILEKKLRHCMELNEAERHALDLELGKYYGALTQNFIEKFDLQPDLIASHGHTVFHQPKRGITLQIGNGQMIKEATGITVINDFRSEDVRLGGQGAPLVPIGDKLLFPEFDYCLNLGGIANISFDDADNQRRAFDVCGCNIVLNYLARQTRRSYDEGGALAAQGTLQKELLQTLNANPYYEITGSKSLGLEDIQTYDIPAVMHCVSRPEDKLRTYVEMIAIQIGKHVQTGKLLVSGGGTNNEFLMQRIQKHCGPGVEITIPGIAILEYKEALIFAFLGVLRLRNEVNVLKSVTGAERDSSSGIII